MPESLADSLERNAQSQCYPQAQSSLSLTVARSRIEPQPLRCYVASGRIDPDCPALARRVAQCGGRRICTMTPREEDAEARQYFDEHYEIIAHHPLVAPRPILLPLDNSDRRQCRFCGRDAALGEVQELCPRRIEPTREHAVMFVRSMRPTRASGMYSLARTMATGPKEITRRFSAGAAYGTPRG